MTTLVAATAALLALSACGESEKKADPSLRVDPSSVTADASGAASTVRVYSTVDWTASSSQSWVTVSPSSGTGASTSSEAVTVNLNIAANTSEARTATVTITSVDGTLSAAVNISQDYYLPEIQDATVKSVQDNTNAYKYQRFRLTGTVRSLSSSGSFSLVDETGSITVDGLNSSEAAYGTSGGALSSVQERYEVTVVGYRVQDGGNAHLAYAFLENATAYSEQSPDEVETVSFPYTADFTASEEGVIINNPVFPYALDAIWTWTSGSGWQATGYRQANYTTESWLYTKKVNLAGAESPVAVFDHAVNAFDDIDAAKDQTALWIKAEGGDWTKLAISFSYPDEQGGTVVTSENIGLGAYIGQTVQFAFQYLSDENMEAGTWRILNFKVIKDEEPEQPGDSSGSEDYNKPGWDWDE